MFTQLEEDLVHLERGQDRLDQHRRLDRARRQLELVFGEVEDVVPEARLEVALELREVQVRAAPPVERSPAVVEEIEAEVEEAARDLLAVHEHVPLGQVPAARAHEEHRGFLAEAIGLLAGVELDRPLDRVDQVRLAVEVVAPGRRVGVLEVGHEAARARVEGVDDHLAVDRPGDLDATVLEVGGDRRDAPLSLADLAGLREEVGQLAGVDPRLPLRSGGQKLAARTVEATMQLGEERERVGAQKLFVTLLERRAKLNPAGDLRTAHGAPLVSVVVAVAEIRAGALGQLSGTQDDEGRILARNVT